VVDLREGDVLNELRVCWRTHICCASSEVHASTEERYLSWRPSVISTLHTWRTIVLRTWGMTTLRTWRMIALRTWRKCPWFVLAESTAWCDGALYRRALWQLLSGCLFPASNTIYLLQDTITAGLFLFTCV
jgi:hypothetical protein